MGVTFSSILLALSGRLAARVLTSLGIGFLSYQGLATLAEKFKTQVISNLNFITPDVLNLMNLAGVGEAFQIILAAIITKAGLMAIKSLAPLLTNN